MRYPAYLAFVVVLGLCRLTQANVEQGFLVIHVADVSGEPVPGVIITANGDSSEPQTDNAGKARIKLASQTQPGEEVTLSIVRSPVGKNLVFVSPWNNRVRVPPFDNKTQNVVDVVLVEAGDRAALENRQVLIALVSRINEANVISIIDQASTQEQRQAHLIAIAKLYGLNPEEIDQAIRDWGAKTNDPYERGLTALYAENYPEATKQLYSSLAIRRTQLTASTDRVIEVATFLGQSLFNEGKYGEAAKAYQEALDISPNDSSIVSDLAMCLFQAGDNYARAESLFQQALAIAIKEKESIKGDQNLANINITFGAFYIQRREFAKAESLLKTALSIMEEMNDADNIAMSGVNQNLGSLYYAEGKYSEAEKSFKKVLAILQSTKAVNRLQVNAMDGLALVYSDQAKYPEAEIWFKQAIELAEKTMGVTHPIYAALLDGLAGVDKKQNKYSEAEVLGEKSLSIREKILGENHPDVALALNNLANTYILQGRYAAAEEPLRRSLAINEKIYGPVADEVAVNLNNLAVIYFKQGKYQAAEPLFQRAVSIDEKLEAPNSSGLPDHLHNLGKLYFMEGRYAEAERLYQRAHTIWTAALGSEHPTIAYSLNDFAALNQKRGNLSEAESLYKKSLAIMERRQSDHRYVATSLNGLADLYADQGKYTEAESLFKRSLAILERILTPSHPDLLKTLDNYARLLRKMHRIDEAKQIEERATANRTKAQIKTDQ
jgi:tetratricopeptide (TPR) repeat protein